ncbi:hypothetical protein [Rivibacter subsaxonicus]|uniref:Spy/CpxP family protein refolding chaperone n=1 Tax=Rivibacter subsaxonicus TaxID=457575 RepID=A0A4Q7W213_9BURK|nr:hypothetical protein [Rivibacter subsaxonicus]RZU02915.1 hypothetical protein EV670_0946 [Rivibacter subsaxonicus]
MKSPIVSRPARGLLFTLLALGAAAPLLAADPAPAKQAAKPAAAAASGTVLTLGKGKPTGQVLTRDQLRACLKEQPLLKASGEEVVQAQTALDARKAEVDKVTAAIATARESVDTTNEQQVNDFNAKVRERTALVDAYNEQLPAFNKQAEAYMGRKDAWQRDCADRPYTELDYFAIQRGK